MPVVRFSVSLLLLPALAVALALAPGRARAAEPTQVPMLDREKEIALALSACPPAIAEHATVYVWDRKAYTKAREGTNGFTALVYRHNAVGSSEPQCMDAAGAKSFLPWMLKKAELKAQGKSREEVKQAIREGWAKGTYRAPERAGVNYMLSTQNVVTLDEDTNKIAPFPPHLMFYAPFVTNADLGVQDPMKSPVFVVDEGMPQALMIVPVGAPGEGHPHSK